jgi:ribosome biogenesis GTPase YqeH
MKDELYCYGCGSIIQTSDETAPGYIKQEVLDSDRAEILCQRCFKMKNYGVLSEVNFNNTELLDLLNKIKEEKCLVVYVLDIFNFHSSLIKNLNEYVKDNPVIVVLNKKDILPKSTSINKLMNYFGDMLWERNILPIDVIAVSSKTGENVDKVMESIYRNYASKNVYIIGMANVGKSTLINQLLKVYSNETTHYITTSQFPGTTLNTISIPLDENTYIYDTPGIINSRSMWQHFDMNVLKKMLPKKQIKPRTYQLNDGQTIFIGGVAAIEYEKGPRTSFTFVISNDIELSRVKSENKEDSFKSMYSKKQLKPSSKAFKLLTDFEKKRINLTSG